MYIQSMDNIKVIFIPTDGVMFDINRYRYNYYCELCKKHNINVTIEEFHKHINNMSVMYKELPLLDFEDHLQLNEEIENHIFEDLKFKYLQMKDGLLEVIHYANQKDIKIVALTTHYSGHAVHYLKKASIYNKVQYITGSDSYNEIASFEKMIQTALDYFNVSPKETLVLSSFDALTEGANKLEANVVYVEDLVGFNDYNKSNYYSHVKDLYEVLNLIMFEKFEQYTMFSNLLGMNSRMSKNELNRRKEALKKDFENDESVLNVIDHTYNYHISQLNEPNLDDKQEKEDSIEKLIIPVEEDIKKETITAAYTLNQKESLELSRLISELNDDYNSIFNIQKEEENVIEEKIEEVKEEVVKEEIIEEIIKEEVKEEKKEEIKEEPVIENDKEEEKVNEEKIEEVKEEKIKKKPFILSFIIGLTDSVIISLWILIIGILLYILFSREINTVPSLAFISQWFNTYSSFINTCVAGLLDTLHSIIPSIPNYEMYINNPALSKDAVTLINIYAGNTTILCILKILKNLIWRKNKPL